jgi:hypothetical protein
VLELEPEHVQALDRRHPAHMDDLAGAVERGDVQPRVLAPVAGRPDHGRDPGRSKVERRRARRQGDVAQPVRLVLPLPGMSPFEVRVDPVEDAVHPPVGVARGRGQILRQQRAAPVEPLQPPDDLDAEPAQHGEIELLAAVRPGERHARSRLGGDRVGHLVDRAVEVAELLQPVPDVLAAVAARHTRVTADCEHDAAVRAAQLGGDLLAARPRADDEDAAGPERLRVPVTARVQLEQVVRCRRGRGGDPRLGGVAGREDDVPRLPGSRVGVDPEAAGRPLDRPHADVLVHARPGERGIAAEVVDELGAAEEARGVAMRRPAVEPVEPVRRQQRQRVPPLGPPALADPAALEDDVPVAGAREVPAERQPGLAGADDQRVRLPHHQCSLGSRPAATSPRKA